MRYSEKLKLYGKDRLWDEYCGFLDLPLSEYMYIQRRLMTEQIRLWSDSGLGKKLLCGRKPETIEEFREALPLTTYEDYADILLSKRADMLPTTPALWIQTTWEGGIRPIKLAPYSAEMLDVYKHNVMAILILAASNKKGDCNVKPGERLLYGGAPLPYATGILPLLLGEEVSLKWLPDANVNSELSFSERIKKGFEMAFAGGMDYMFGIGSVTNYITSKFEKMGSSKSKKKVSVPIALRYLRAKYTSRRDKRVILPKDIFKIKGLVSMGTDAKCYKQKIADAWGRMPIETAAGTESTCLATEDYNRNGMVFFPDACFCEFIPEAEMRKNLSNPSYTPKTVLMDEVSANANYELVISVLKGGAFARYRIGDMYRCVSGPNGNRLPRFTFLDRTPDVIDIAGFTRITQKSVEEVIERSRLRISAWIAKKEFTENNTPFLHMYIEIPPDAQLDDTVTVRVLLEHLSVYFKSFDSDYDDLKKLLEMDPLQLTVLKYSTIKRYEERVGYTLERINPPDVDVNSLLRLERGFAQYSKGVSLR